MTFKLLLTRVESLVASSVYCQDVSANLYIVVCLFCDRQLLGSLSL